MNFCINCKFYGFHENYKQELHSCNREVHRNINPVTGKSIPGYQRDAEVERAGNASAGYCGKEGIFFMKKSVDRRGLGLGPADGYC